MEIYTKQNTHVVTELEPYSAKSMKVCWFGKSVHLATTHSTIPRDKSIVKLGLHISVDKLHKLINVLSNINKTDTNHYCIISQRKNWKKEKELQTSEFNGLELAQFSAAEGPIEIVDTPDQDEEDYIPLHERSNLPSLTSSSNNSFASQAVNNCK